MKAMVKHSIKVTGEVQISGSKNVVLPVICAALLTNKTVTLYNVPNIKDVEILIEIIKSIGVNVKYLKHKQILKIKAKKVNHIILNNKINKLRGSYYLIGVLLARYNKCITTFPGGCNFTDRPIDYHIDAFKQLGYLVKNNRNFIFINKFKERNNEIKLLNKSVGASINTILSCCYIKEEVVIKNISLEPEVLEIIEFIKLMGKEINIAQNQLFIKGEIIHRNIHFNIVSDRIEAGSYALLAASTQTSSIRLINAPVKYMYSVLEVLKKLGLIVKVEQDIIKVKKIKKINPIDLEIFEYPSFPTDLQQILSVVLLTSSGISKIKDNIYINRISQIKELNKLDGLIQFINNEIIIYPSELKGGIVSAHDLRCAFALIVAGVISSNETIIDNFDIVLRGYEKIIEKLKKVGIEIKIYI